MAATGAAPLASHSAMHANITPMSITPWQRPLHPDASVGRTWVGRAQQVQLVLGANAALATPSLRRLTNDRVGDGSNPLQDLGEMPLQRAGRLGAAQGSCAPLAEVCRAT